MLNFDFLDHPFSVTPKFIERQIMLLYQEDRESYNKIAPIAIKMCILKTMYDDALTVEYQPLIDATKLQYERIISDVKHLLYS